MRDDEDIGWLYIKKSKSKRGEFEAGTDGEISAFEEGDQVTSEEFEPKVALGYIEDEDMDNEKLVDMFKERLLEVFEELDGVEPASGSKIDKILDRMGKKKSKKYLAKLRKRGVDLLIVGRLSGENGRRRLDFEVLSTLDGKRVIKIKRDGIGL